MSFHCFFVLHWVDILQYICPFCIWWTVQLFQFSSIMNDVAENSFVHISCSTCVTVLLGSYLGVELLGWMMIVWSTLLITIRQCLIVFESVWTNFTPNSNEWELPFTPNPCWCLLSFTFNFYQTVRCDKCISLWFNLNFSNDFELLICWNQLVLVYESWLCTFLLNCMFKDIRLLAWNQPWWGYLHPQMQ